MAEQVQPYSREEVAQMRASLEKWLPMLKNDMDFIPRMRALATMEALYQENDWLRARVEGLAHRVASQSDQLSRRAEKS